MHVDMLYPYWDGIHTELIDEVSQLSARQL